jgi:formyltetrahydrofolate synthetase
MTTALPACEGKPTTAVSLTQDVGYVGREPVPCLREHRRRRENRWSLPA